MAEAASNKNLAAPVLGKTTKVSLDANVFGEPFNGTIVHEVVRAERNAMRSGNASTKSRGEIAMTGAKAWRQKGTGRARVGALSAGHRRGGGVTFGPTPRDYVFKVNKKVRRKALRAALSLHAERGTLAIVEGSTFSKPSTGDAFDSLADWKDSGTVAVITAGESDVNTTKSFRNIGRVRNVMAADQVSVYELTAAQNLVISQEALESLTEIASTEIDRASKKPIEAVAVKTHAPKKKKRASKPAVESASEETSSSTKETSAGEASSDATSDEVAESTEEATE